MASSFQSKIKGDGVVGASKKSLFQTKIHLLKKADSKIFSTASHRVVYARAGGEEFLQNGLLNGDPIDMNMASALKTIVWGSACSQISPLWQGVSLSFHSGGDVNAYGLKCPQNGTKNFLICLQAYLLKTLLFDKKSKAGTHQKYGTSKGIRGNLGAGKAKAEQWTNTLRPTDRIQSEILIGGLTSLFLKVSEGKGGVLCFPSEENCFEPAANYSMDGITEKLHIFRAEKDEDVQSTIKKLSLLLAQENGNGLLAVLYSLILTRGLERLREDMQDQKDSPLIDSNGDCSQALLNMIILGRGTPYLHNGTVVSSEQDELDSEFCGIEKMGVMGRNEIGLLLWEKNEETTAHINVGSRLKTPTFPIWLTCCNRQFGILFNPNKELMKSYQAERRFQLFYYADHCGKKDEPLRETVITVNNSNTNENRHNLDYGLNDFDEVEENPLEQAIKTKWNAAQIDWNNTAPYIW